MEFRDKEGIYLQIATYVGEQIILGRWSSDEKVPSVRELAVELQVNPNTVVRAYELLQNKEVIVNKRGVGFFVHVDAKSKIKEYTKERFLSLDLPDFFKQIYLLNISIEELEKRYKKFVAEHYSA